MSVIPTSSGSVLYHVSDSDGGCGGGDGYGYGHGGGDDACCHPDYWLIYTHRYKNMTN